MNSEAVLQAVESMLKLETMEGTLTSPKELSVSTNAEPEVSNEELLVGVRRRSTEALAILFRRHARAVFHIARRILRDEAEAADIRQEVFLYIFEKARHFDPQKGTAASWIMQIAYHRAIDRRRYLSSRQHYAAPVFDEQQSHVASELVSTDAIDGKAILSRLRETLSPDQQETLELHLFEGYTLREIAEKNGQSVGNVRNHYYRALERLRAHIFPAKRK